MNMRLLMLILTVGAFVVMWSGDHQASNPKYSNLEGIRNLQKSAWSTKLPLTDSVTVSLFLEQVEGKSDPIALSGSTETDFSLACLPESDWMSSKQNVHYHEYEAIPQYQIITSSLRTEDWDLTSTLFWIHHSEVTLENSDPAIPVPVDFSPGEYRIFNDAGAEYVKNWTRKELDSIGIPSSVPVRNSYMLEEQGRRWYFFRVNQSRILSLSIESQTKQIVSIRAFSEECETDASDSFDPIEPIAERILFVKQNLEMSVCRMKWFFRSISINVKSTIREAADKLSGLTAEVLQRTRPHWERREDISTKTERVETPVIGIQSATRFRCQRFY